MTKGEAKKLALRWLDEATLNGQPASAELTMDYTDKFDFFLWYVVVFISAIFKISETYRADEENLEPKGNYYRVELPDNFIGLNTIHMYNSSYETDITDYLRESTRAFLIPKTYFNGDNKVEIIYWRMPEKFDETASDATELDVVKKAEQLVPLRLAIEATAGSDETNAISAYLEGKFSSMVNNLITDENDYAAKSIERVYAL